MKKLSLVLSFAIATQCYLFSDEGMWPLNMIPNKEIQKQYGVELTPSWIEQVQKSALRMSSGGSASFVSASGLLMTNHHVGAKAIYNLSSEGRDLMSDGFYAETPPQELKCPNLYVDQLISIQDVTGQITSQISNSLSLAEREKERQSAIARLSKKVQEETGLQPQVVKLYHGAKYHLYLYKRYNDIRLVMAPEKEIAFFGGDPENFEYPRSCLDVCFFRVYDNNEPLKTAHYLRWSKSGPKLGEPLFVVGHPGGTDRKLTAAHLTFLKEKEIPFLLQLIDERIHCLTQFSNLSEENRRIASQDFFSLSNVKKVYTATLSGLQNSPIIQNKEKLEKELFAETNALSSLQQALQQTKSYYEAYQVLEGMASRTCKLHLWAKILVRAADEKAKPNEQRLKEFADSELPALELFLFSTEPVYPSFEQAQFILGLQRIVRFLGNDHPAVEQLLNGTSIEEFAASCITKTKLVDVTYRKQLYSNPQEVAASQDPFIALAKLFDSYGRELRERHENEYESTEKECYAKIHECLFEKYGESLYPDATFTLRLSVGTMQGYEDIAPTTPIERAYQTASELEPYQLPKRWLQKKETLDKKVPFNFISTNDIIGGNSGSPVINKEGQVVGIIFDGNAHAFLWNYEFDQTKGRAVSVHSQAIVETLKNVYEAHALVKEIVEAS